MGRVTYFLERRENEFTDDMYHDSHLLCGNHRKEGSSFYTIKGWYKRNTGRAEKTRPARSFFSSFVHSLRRVGGMDHDPSISDRVVAPISCTKSAR